MSYVFNAEEKEKIIDAVSVCTGMKFDLHDKEYKAVAVVSTNCEPFYQTLSDMIGEKLSGFVVLMRVSRRFSRVLSCGLMWRSMRTEGTVLIQR